MRERCSLQTFEPLIDLRVVPRVFPFRTRMPPCKARPSISLKILDMNGNTLRAVSHVFLVSSSQNVTQASITADTKYHRTIVLLHD
jgi:hypothetical protein